MTFNIDNLTITEAYPYENYDLYTTIDACQAMYNHLLHQNTILKICVIIIVTLTLVYLIYRYKDSKK